MQQQGAGAKTRLESSMKKFKPYLISDFFFFRAQRQHVLTFFMRHVLTSFMRHCTSTFSGHTNNATLYVHFQMTDLGRAPYCYLTWAVRPTGT